MPVYRDSPQRKTIKISNISFAMLASYQKSSLELIGHPVYFGIYSLMKPLDTL